MCSLLGIVAAVMGEGWSGAPGKSQEHFVWGRLAPACPSPGSPWAGARSPGQAHAQGDRELWADIWQGQHHLQELLCH